jgi:hypothetical protein
VPSRPLWVLNPFHALGWVESNSGLGWNGFEQQWCGLG